MQSKQKRDKIRKVAYKLFAEYNLDGFKFGFTSAKVQGLCKPHVKYIALNGNFADNSSYELMLEVLLHEITHALLPSECGHNEKFFKTWEKTVFACGQLPEAEKRILKHKEIDKILSGISEKERDAEMEAEYYN